MPVARRVSRRRRLASGAAIAAGGWRGSRSAAAGRPNLVVVVLDDMRDSEWAEGLPETRAWVDQHGTWFPNFFMNTPQCVPSRSMILTGRYSHSNGVIGNHGGEGGFEQFRQRGLGPTTFAVPAQAAGYHTALIGKYINHYPEEHGTVPPGWETWCAAGNPDYRDFTLNIDGKARRFRVRHQYLTDVLRDHAVAFVNGVPAGEPLLLYLGLKPPHKPDKPDGGDGGGHSDATARKNDAFNEADVSDKPKGVRNRHRLSGRAVKHLDKLERARLDSLADADRTIGAVRQALGASGRLADTCFLVFSDNGFLMGEHRLVPKEMPYNGATRCTLGAVGPRFAAGATDDRLAGTVDIAATLADLGGFDVPASEGRSLVGPAARTAMLLEHLPTGWRSVRTKHEVYTEWDSGEREYYDLGRDPDELENGLADWSGHTPTTAAVARAATLAPVLAALRDCTGNACLSADRKPL